MSSTPHLDRLLARARRVEVRPDPDVLRIARTAPTAEPARPWWTFAIGAGAVAALAVVVAIVVWPRQRAAEPVRVGDRVAVAAEPGTRYRVATAEDDRTEVEIERGAVTARLWPGDRRHELVLRGGGVEAIATGTVYTLGVDDHGAWVHVAEGSVLVRDAGGERRVAAGEAWPAARVDTGAAAKRLLAMPAPPVDAGPTITPIRPLDPPRDAGPGIAQDEALTDAAPAEAQVRRRAPLDATDGGVPAADASVPTLTDRWRKARLLRAQGEPQRALDECLAIADENDATWSPIALVEAIRIELDALSSPEKAVDVADRMLREWPSHNLAPEAKTLRCRALKQLGRDCAGQGQ